MLLIDFLETFAKDTYFQKNISNNYCQIKFRNVIVSNSIIKKKHVLGGRHSKNTFTRK